MAVLCHPLNDHIPRPPSNRSLMKWLHLHSTGVEVTDDDGNKVRMRCARIEQADTWTLKLICSNATGASALIDAATPSQVGACKIVPRALSVVDGYQTGVLLEFEHDAPRDVVRAA
jgi:hypothetical protein